MKKRTIPFDKIQPETRLRLARWLADSLRDMEVDAEQIAEEYGEDFMPAWRGLVAHLEAS